MLAAAELRRGLFRAALDATEGRPGLDAALGLAGTALAATGLVLGIRAWRAGDRLWGRAAAGFHALILLSVGLAILLGRFEAILSA